MHRFAVIAAAGVLLFCGQASAQSEPATPTADSAAKSEKLICRKDIVTGSRLNKKKTCMTAKEWDRFERQNREDAATMTENRAVSGDTLQTGAGTPPK